MGQSAKFEVEPAARDPIVRVAFAPLLAAVATATVDAHQSAAATLDAGHRPRTISLIVERLCVDPQGIRWWRLVAYDGSQRT
ncbi:hypothetical protein GCM10011400_22690 [Paraburkholderia caffeinilytica]|uniref:Uncharacterized protein n=1 Tax=Paraburkholderia caffeinilytica TaxID=1761016 RepID=A0ABQ1M720_9BURK|nr:hypothetical protein GCM10011400_22690 [Paraburkholderia caffeinilytica]